MIESPRIARGAAEMTAAMVISGTIGWFVLQSGQPVLDVVFWRCAFGAATLLPICAAMGLLRGLRPRILLFAALGGAAIVINWVLLFASYSHASISIATAIYNVQPFILVGFGVFLFGEKLTLTRLIWLMFAFAGMLLIVSTKPDASYTGQNYALGILMALGAAFFYALAAVVAKALKGVAPHLIALIHTLVGVLMLAPFAAFEALPASLASWSSLVTLGVVHTGLMYILLYGAIQKLPTHLTGALSFIYPVVAILVDVLALDHHLHWAQILGASAILVAAAGMNLGWSPLGRAKRLKEIA